MVIACPAWKAECRILARQPFVCHVPRIAAFLEADSGDRPLLADCWFADATGI